MSTSQNTGSAASRADGSLDGKLFTYYNDGHSRVAFITNQQHRRHIIHIGGLGDGLMPTPYTIPLSQALNSRGWALVQVLMSSSYTGFGHLSLRNDSQELTYLVDYLTEHYRSESIGLVGHSTGCQDSVFYLKTSPSKEKIHLLVLQAPASDRDIMMEAEGAETYRNLALQMRSEGKGEEMLPRAAFFVPITANRFLDFTTREGLDDMFSSDLSDEELSQRLGHIDRPTLFLHSGADEYVPSRVNVTQLGARMSQSVAPEVVGKSRYEIVEGAKHNGKGKEKDVVDSILRFVQEVTNT